jgi:hypothetical protein
LGDGFSVGGGQNGTGGGDGQNRAAAAWLGSVSPGSWCAHEASRASGARTARTRSCGPFKELRDQLEACMRQGYRGAGVPRRVATPGPLAGRCVLHGRSVRRHGVRSHLSRAWVHRGAAVRRSRACTARGWCDGAALWSVGTRE